MNVAGWKAAGWDVLPDGTIGVPKWDHEHRWGPWTEFVPREGHPGEFQRSRVCLNGCDVDMVNTEFRPDTMATTGEFGHQ